MTTKVVHVTRAAVSEKTRRVVFVLPWSCQDDDPGQRCLSNQRPEIRLERLETRRFLGRKPEFLAVCRIVVSNKALVGFQVGENHVVSSSFSLDCRVAGL